MAHETPQEQNVRLKLENEALKKQLKEVEVVVEIMRKCDAAGASLADWKKFLGDLEARKKAEEERNKKLLEDSAKEADKKEKEEEKKAEDKGSKPNLLGQIFGDFKKLLS